nr:hypothetical protein [Tanacetum cinerariifolium]
MDMTIDQQVALDEALVPHASRLRIGRSNFRLQSDISSKESTLQLVYDVLRQTPFFKAFLATGWLTARLATHDFCNTGLRLSQAQVLWGFYHKRNVDFAYLLWEDFVYQVEHKDTKKSNGMYYPRYDQMFTTIKLVSRHQNTQQFGAMLPIELTNADIKNSEAYKEYYAVATGATPPKTKTSVRKTKSSSDTTITPPLIADAGIRLFTSAKGKQPAKASKAKSLTALSEVAMIETEQLKQATKRSLQQTYISQASGLGADEGTGTIPGVPDVPTEESGEEISWKSSDEGDDDENVDEGSDDQDDDDDQEEGSDDEQAFYEEGEEFIHPSLSSHDEEETKDEESFDPIAKTPENTDYEGNGEENLGLNVGREERQDEEDDEDELYRDVNINMEGRVVQMADVHTTQEFKDSHVTLTPVNPDGQQQSLFVSSQFVTSLLNPTLDAGIESIFETTSQMDVQPPTTVGPLPLSAPTLTPATFATITTIPQAPTPLITTPSTLLQNLPNFGSLFGFDHQLKTLEDNFSEFVQTNQFAGAVSSIPGIVQRYMDQRMNEAVKVAVQIQSDRLRDEAQAENKEFLMNLDENIQKIIKNQIKEQVKALVEAYESDKIILDTYGDTVTLKRRRDDDANKDEEPSSGSDRGSKRRREGNEPESASAPTEKATRSTGKSTQGADDQPIAEPSQHPEWFSQQKKPPTPDPFLMNRLKVDTLTPKLLAGPTYELTKGSCKSLVELEFFLEEVYKASTDQLDWINPEGQQYPHNLLKPLPLIPNSRGHRVIPFDHFINNDLEYLREFASSRKYTTYVKTKAANYGHIKWIEDLVPRTMWIQKPVGYDKHALWEISHWGRKLAEWHNYKHLDWITVRRDDDKLYKFKEGEFKRLRIQDIEDMLLLLVQGKLTNLTVEEHFAFNVFLRMFTRSIVIQRRVEDLQLGVESYQKKLNLTRPDTYRFDLKCKEDYTAYSNPRGFIYQNKDKQKRLMRIDELHKFSDGTLTDVRNALDDRLKGIRMKYLP